MKPEWRICGSWTLLNCQHHNLVTNLIEDSKICARVSNFTRQCWILSFTTVHCEAFSITKTCFCFFYNRVSQLCIVTLHGIVDTTNPVIMGRITHSCWFATSSLWAHDVTVSVPMVWVPVFMMWLSVYLWYGYQSLWCDCLNTTNSILPSWIEQEYNSQPCMQIPKSQYLWPGWWKLSFTWPIIQ